MLTSRTETGNLKDEIITPDLDIDITDIRSALVTVAHLQPTDRPIEDRYSAHFDKTQNRLILGVYDGMFEFFFVPKCFTQFIKVMEVLKPLNTFRKLFHLDYSSTRLLHIQSYS